MIFINEKDTSFVDCKHKHMMKSGVSPDKFGVLYHIDSCVYFSMLRAKSIIYHFYKHKKN